MPMNNVFCFVFNSSEEKEEIPPKSESTPPRSTPTNLSTISQPIAPTAMPEVDEDGYCIQPKDHLWETQAKKKGKNKIC